MRAELPTDGNSALFAVGCAALVVEGGRKIIACAPEVERWLNFGAGQALRPGAFTRLPPPLRKVIREAGEGRPVVGRSLRLTGSKASAVAIQASALPVETRAGGRLVVVLLELGAVGGGREENLRRLDRLASLGTLSAGLGHEIKNALVAVKTFVDLLLEQNPDAELSEVVRRELRRMDSIVSQMLRFAGPGQPEFSDVHLHDVLDHSLRLVQYQLKLKAITLRRSFKAAPDLLRGDDCRLEQAFVNLLLNAIEAMGTDSALIVTTDLVRARPPGRPTRRRPFQLCVTITDTGGGVAPENLGRLFEPFFTTKPQGTGLGLSIARRIIQEHQGHIGVRSRLQRGTTFTILLPAAARSPQLPAR